MADNSYLPQTGDDLDLIEFAMEQQPSHTYKLDISRGRVKGITEDADALLQAVYLILSVERYQYPIYSYNYGVELADLIGRPKDFGMSEVKCRITDALTQDDRINSVDGWEIPKDSRHLLSLSTRTQLDGDIELKEVDV